MRFNATEVKGMEKKCFLPSEDAVIVQSQGEKKHTETSRLVTQHPAKLAEELGKQEMKTEITSSRIVAQRPRKLAEEIDTVGSMKSMQTKNSAENVVNGLSASGKTPSSTLLSSIFIYQK